MYTDINPHDIYHIKISSEVIVIENLIKEIREKAEIKQIDLAKVLNIRQSTISMWENGEAEPSRENLIKLADYFKVSTDYLLGRGSPGDTA